MVSQHQVTSSPGSDFLRRDAPATMSRRLVEVVGNGDGEIQLLRPNSGRNCSSDCSLQQQSATAVPTSGLVDVIVFRFTGFMKEKGIRR